MVHKLETMATTDGLTGLLNKRAMLDAAMQEGSPPRRASIASLLFLVLDIDFFQEGQRHARARHGRPGHSGLGRDSQATESARPNIVARFGGEEFVVLCEQTDEERRPCCSPERNPRGVRQDELPCRGESVVSVTCSGGRRDAARRRQRLGFPSSRPPTTPFYLSKRSGRGNRSTAWRPRSQKERQPLRSLDTGRSRAPWFLAMSDDKPTALQDVRKGVGPAVSCPQETAAEKKLPKGGVEEVVVTSARRSRAGRWRNVASAISSGKSSEKRGAAASAANPRLRRGRRKAGAPGGDGRDEVGTAQATGWAD